MQWSPYVLLSCNELVAARLLILQIATVCGRGERSCNAAMMQLLCVHICMSNNFADANCT